MSQYGTGATVTRSLIWLTSEGAMAVQHANATDARGLGAKATDAFRRGEWSIALGYFDLCLKQLPDNSAVPHWLAMRAAALGHLGRTEEAEAVYLAIMKNYPTLRAGYAGLAWIAERQNNWPRALAALDTCLKRFPSDPGARKWREARASLLERLGARCEAGAAWDELIKLFPEAADQDWRIKAAMCRDDLSGVRAALRNDLAAAETIPQLERIFTQTPIAFEGWDRLQVWLNIDQRLGSLSGDESRQNDGRARILRMRLKLALRDYDGFLTCFDRAAQLELGAWRRKFYDTSRLLKSKCFPDFSAEKIFGIGLSRTGTKSLSQALQVLGIHTAHYTNDFTEEILNLDDAFLFDGLTDTPVCIILETLFYTFPNAKFIYTVRPLDSWVTGFERHLRRNGLSNAFDRSRSRLTTRGTSVYGTQRALLHGGLYYHYPDPEAAWHAYDARVRSFFGGRDGKRFLEFNVFLGDSWEKLCRFLDRPIPAEPFPWENRAFDANSMEADRS